jgi:cytochrome c oxidase subunit 4
VPNTIIVMNVLRASRIAARPRTLLAIRAASTTVSPIRSSNSAVSLANVEAQWERLSSEEQVEVHRELEALQKRDWKTLSIDEKKAGEYVLGNYLLGFFTSLRSLLPEIGPSSMRVLTPYF